VEDDDHGDEDDQDRNEDDDLVTSDLARPRLSSPKAVAQMVLRRAMTQGSVSAWVRPQGVFKNIRNRNEALALAGIIDSINGKDLEKALETALLRLAAVHSADCYGDWRIAEVIQTPSEAECLLDAHVLQSILRQAATVQRVERAASGFKSKGRAPTAAGGGRGRFNHRDRSGPPAAGSHQRNFPPRSGPGKAGVPKE
jgi:hypothetical protein